MYLFIYLFKLKYPTQPKFIVYEYAYIYSIFLYSLKRQRFLLERKNISEKDVTSTNGTNAKYHSNEEEGEGEGVFRGGILDTTFGITEMINTLSFENAQLFMRALLPPP